MFSPTVILSELSYSGAIILCCLLSVAAENKDCISEKWEMWKMGDVGKVGEMDLAKSGKIIPVNCSPVVSRREEGKECSVFKRLIHFYINMKFYFFLSFSLKLSRILS